MGNDVQDLNLIVQVGIDSSAWKFGQKVNPVYVKEFIMYTVISCQNNATIIYLDRLYQNNANIIYQEQSNCFPYSKQKEIHSMAQLWSEFYLGYRLEFGEKKLIQILIQHAKLSKNRKQWQDQI